MIRCALLLRFHGDAGTEQIGVTVCCESLVKPVTRNAVTEKLTIIDSCNTRPELPLLEIRKRESCLLWVVRSIPVLSDQVFCAVWAHLKNVDLLIGFAVLDVLDLSPDAN